MLNSLLLRPERLGDPLTLTVNFAGPIKAGEFLIDAKLVRSNRSTQHWAVQLFQGEDRDPLVSAIAVFATRRPTWGLTEAVPPPVAGPQAGEPQGPFANLAWPHMYDMRYVRGHTLEQNPGSVTHSWIRDAPPRDMDFASLTAIADAFFPRIFLRRPREVPIATVSLNIYFHVDARGAFGSWPTTRAGGCARSRLSRGLLRSAWRAMGRGRSAGHHPTDRLVQGVTCTESGEGDHAGCYNAGTKANRLPEYAKITSASTHAETPPMHAKTKYIFIASMDIDPDKEALFNEVYDTEHVPFVLKVPGVLSATRTKTEPLSMVLGGERKTIVAEGEPRYSAMYELESAEVLVSDAWAKAVEQGRWPAEVRPHTRNRRHVLRKVILSKVNS